MIVEVRQTDPDWLGPNFTAKPADVMYRPSLLVVSATTQDRTPTWKQHIVHVVQRKLGPGESFWTGQVRTCCGLHVPERNCFEITDRLHSFRARWHSDHHPKPPYNVWYRLCQRCRD